VVLSASGGQNLLNSLALNFQILGGTSGLLARPICARLVLLVGRCPLSGPAKLGHLPAVALGASGRLEEGAEGVQRSQQVARPLGQQATPLRWAHLDEHQNCPQETGVKHKHGQLDVYSKPAGPEEGPLVVALVLASLSAAPLWLEDAKLVVNEWRIYVSAQELQNFGGDIDTNGTGCVQGKEFLQSNQQTHGGDQSSRPDCLLGRIRALWEISDQDGSKNG